MGTSKRQLRLMGLLALALLAASCASMPGQRQARASAPLPTISAAEAPVRPGDRVAVVVWNEPEVSGEFLVADNGTVSLPKLGIVEIGGRSIAEFQAAVREGYSEFLRNPSIDINVLRRVGISGEVRGPGIYYIDLTMTLPDLITRAGGITEAGDENRITVSRGVDEYSYARSDRESFVSAQLQSGDQVFVEPRSFYSRNSFTVITTGFTLLTVIITQIIPVLRDL